MSTSTTGRPVFSRYVALAVGALALSGLALVGVDTSASASSALQAGRLCASLSSENERDRDCGRRASVELDESAKGVGLMYPGRRTCVVVHRDEECARNGWATAGSSRGFLEVRVYVQNTRFCGRAGSNGVWAALVCSDSRGWLTLEAHSDIDSLSLWTPRARPRH
jgi:hypothetical protein